MKAAAIILTTLGIIMFIARVLCGALSGFLLSGWGFHGWKESVGWGPGLMAAFMSLFPSGTAGLLRVPWWLPPIAFGLPLLVLVFLAVSDSEQWWRVPMAAGFVGIGLAAGRIFQSSASK